MPGTEPRSSARASSALTAELSLRPLLYHFLIKYFAWLPASWSPLWSFLMVVIPPIIFCAIHKQVFRKQSFKGGLRHALTGMGQPEEYLVWLPACSSRSLSTTPAELRVGVPQPSTQDHSCPLSGCPECSVLRSPCLLGMAS